MVLGPKTAIAQLQQLYKIRLLLTVFIYVPPDIEENEDLAVSSGESGSGSGEILPENDKEMHKILDLQTSIPYKKRKTKPAT